MIGCLAQKGSSELLKRPPTRRRPKSSMSGASVRSFESFLSGCLFAGFIKWMMLRISAVRLATNVLSLDGVLDNQAFERSSDRRDKSTQQQRSTEFQPGKRLLL
ncbi:hypothetical protein ACLKA6_016422 [Drosophila palustris]